MVPLEFRRNTKVPPLKAHRSRGANAEVARKNADISSTLTLDVSLFDWYCETIKYRNAQLSGTTVVDLLQRTGAPVGKILKSHKADS